MVSPLISIAKLFVNGSTAEASREDLHLDHRDHDFLNRGVLIGRRLPAFNMGSLSDNRSRSGEPENRFTGGDEHSL